MIKLKQKKYEIQADSTDTFLEMLNKETYGTNINPEFSMLNTYLHGTSKSFVGYKKNNFFSIYRYKEQIAQFRPDILIKGRILDTSDNIMLKCSYEINVSGFLSLLLFLVMFFFLGNTWFGGFEYGIISSVFILLLYILFARLELKKTEKIFNEKLKDYVGL